MSNEFYYGSIVVMAIAGILYAYYSDKNKIDHSFF